jgi:hypothetical protein
MEELVHVCTVSLSAALPASHGSMDHGLIVKLRENIYQYDSRGVGILLEVAAQRKRGSI